MQIPDFRLAHFAIMAQCSDTACPVLRTNNQQFSLYSSSLFSNWLEESLMAQPVGTRLGPGRAGMVAGADAEIMGGRGINVQLRRHAGLLESEVHQDTMLGRTDD